MRRAPLLLLLLLLPAVLRAQPDLGKQDAWGDKEKKEFLEYLRSGQGAAAPGQVRSVKLEGTSSKSWSPRKPFYLSAAFAADSLMTVGGNGALRREGLGLGPKVLAGGHIFTWLRYYAGAMNTPFRQEKIDGTRPLVNHFQFPVGLEVALVPLGTPHTRYLLLRAGTAAHYFDGRGQAASDFKTPLLGWQTSWNGGLGYEWQISDTRWRLNGLVEGYHYMLRQGSTARFSGLGFTLGAVYTF